ncbi:MAG: hypothetical protein ACTSVB_06235 [Candidatus Heimdallarchaeaceae archaeon]
MRKNLISFSLMYLVIISTFSFVITSDFKIVSAGSSSSGDIPPPGGQGGEDTSGGGAAGGLYLNYRIPLIFKKGDFAPTFIAITALPIFQNETIVIFGYNSSLYENNQAIIKGNETLIINPRDEPELTNGSLIQSFSPLQITVFHPNTNNESDNSFSYSVLVMQNWGKKYLSSFSDMRAIIVSGFNSTKLTINNNGIIQYETIDLIGQILDISVSKGTIIEANGPIGVVFYSLTESQGSFAYTGVPYYMWGKEYFSLPPPRETHDSLIEDNSTLVLGNINEGGTVIFETSEEESDILNLEVNQTITLEKQNLDTNDYYTRFLSAAVNYSVTTLYSHTINGTIHKSAFQYIATEKMKWAEWFYNNKISDNLKISSVSLDDSNIILPIVLFEGQLLIDLENYSSVDRGDYYSYKQGTSYGVISANGSLFVSQIVSDEEKLLENSLSHLLFPMNLYSFVDNKSSSFPSWYHFPNINVKEVNVYPEKPTELRKIKLEIVIQNNGTIPSAPFWVSIFRNDTVKIHKKIEGLDINETFCIPFEEFQGFGLKTLNISIYTDSLSQIFELIEFDNAYELMIKINRNWNIIYVGIAVSVLITGYLSYLVIRKFVAKYKENKRKFDIILSEVEV